MTHNPRPGDESAPWAERGVVQCAVDGCQQRAITHGRCEPHAEPSEHMAARTRLGEPSGHGRFGLVDRGPDWVLCHECGRTFKRLEKHIIGTHEMDVVDYRAAHGLRAGDSLLCQDLIDRFSETAKARIGSPDWRRLEEARTAGRAALEESAAEANRGRARAASVPPSSREGVTERECLICGTRFPVSGTRSREVCSQECWHESKVRAAGRRAAQKRGEVEDFVGREGSGRRLRLLDVARELGLTETTLRTRLRRGQFREHAGREHWVAFWWESDLL